MKSNNAEVLDLVSESPVSSRAKPKLASVVSKNVRKTNLPKLNSEIALRDAIRRTG
ncbi:MAG: hypothetical protein KTR32_32980 [Granulosicoccus sp.]|nr:hypothetical protein [Granulosicoccus sp.]